MANLATPRGGYGICLGRDEERQTPSTPRLLGVHRCRTFRLELSVDLMFPSVSYRRVQPYLSGAHRHYSTRPTNDQSERIRI